MLLVHVYVHPACVTFLYVFDFFLFLLVSAANCACDTPWAFYLTFCCLVVILFYLRTGSGFICLLF